VTGSKVPAKPISHTQEFEAVSSTWPSPVQVTAGVAVQTRAPVTGSADVSKPVSQTQVLVVVSSTWPVKVQVTAGVVVGLTEELVEELVTLELELMVDVELEELDPELEELTDALEELELEELVGPTELELELLEVGPAELEELELEELELELLEVDSAELELEELVGSAD